MVAGCLEGPLSFSNLIKSDSMWNAYRQIEMIKHHLRGWRVV